MEETAKVEAEVGGEGKEEVERRKKGWPKGVGRKSLDWTRELDCLVSGAKDQAKAELENNKEQSMQSGAVVERGARWTWECSAATSQGRTSQYKIETGKKNNNALTESRGWAGSLGFWVLDLEPRHINQRIASVL